MFSSQMLLDVHSKAHNKEYKCTKCLKSFVHLGGLNNHLRLHAEPHTICLYCGRKFNSKAECKYHESLHIRGKHICEVCDKYFDTKNQLYEHSQMHGPRPYVCEICGLAFRRPFTLKSHMHRHVSAEHSGSFVLMVDMKEDDDKNKLLTNIEIDDPKTVENNVPINLENELPANYIDMGNGNYLKVQGNTINIDGTDYILLNENEANVNQQYQMIVDEKSTENQITEEESLNNTMMLVDGSDQLLINENQVNQQYYMTSDDISKQSTTYIIDSQFMPDDHTITFQTNN